MRYNSEEFLTGTIGMPVAHKDVFLTVAREQRCVIMVRATGRTCHGPLDEGYDTKGYRIHGKSCDWGPMAGFVMRDPRLNKYGLRKAAFNREKHRESLELDAEGQGWLASTTPLKISQTRVDWLIRNDYISVLEVQESDRGPHRLDGSATHPTGVNFYYSLIRDPGDPVYGVYFSNRFANMRWNQQKGDAAVTHPVYRGGRDTRFESMLAMTNPPGHRLHAAEHFRNAVTGDYDLFAVWPFVRGTGRYNPRLGGLDHRPLGTVRGSVGAAERANVEHLERHFTVGGQGTKLGNITARIYMVCQLINSYIGRHVLWHSDEAARPFLDDVDLPVMAFTPARNFFGIENVLDFRIYIAYCEMAGMAVTLSNAWAQAPDARHPNRLGTDYARFVPPDGQRLIVPDYYNG